MGNCAVILNNQSRGKIVSRDAKNSGHKPRAQWLTQNIIKEIRDKDIDQFYDIDQMTVLGTGVNGLVQMCIHKATKLKFALKTLNKVDLPPEDILNLRNEVSCMARLDHPNILRVHEVLETDACIYLVMELCQGGHLLDRLSAQEGHYFREKVACKYIYSILSAIAYCHANNVVHRDLKLENILFVADGRESELKIIGNLDNMDSAVPLRTHNYSY